MIRAIVIAAACALAACTAGSPALSPAEVRDCGAAGAVLAVLYVAELDARCGAFAGDYAKCPEFDAIETKFRALDRAAAEACVARD